MIDAKTVAELAAKQIEALYDADVCSPAQNYCRNKLRMEAAADAMTDLSTRISELEAENARLREALSRQGDNMAFVLNHMTMPSAWYAKFSRELEEDRAALTEGQGDG